MSRLKLQFHFGLLWLSAHLPTPARKPLKTCGSCSTQNEPDRTTCIGCGGSI